ncbi:ABC transporter ATP-binding protein [Polaromonas sp. P2-4]|nr:ABC transporter ATP-binding protein [Polaromonas sp. P2-4]
MDKHLELRGVSKRFGTAEVLSDVDLTIARGEFVCLLGPSGCGKTTLLRIISGFESASRGQLLLDGQEISHVAPHLRGFGMVFQSLALFPHMTVAENIAYGMKLKGVAPAQRASRVEELLHMVQLPAIADRPVSALSGGQRQRVAIARTGRAAQAVFAGRAAVGPGRATARQHADRAAAAAAAVWRYHHRGHARPARSHDAVGSPGRPQRRARPAMRYPVAGLSQTGQCVCGRVLGAANLLPGVVRGPGVIEVLGGALALPTSLPTGSAVTLAVRSEDLRFEPTHLDAPARPNSIAGEIDFLRDLGAKSELILRCGDERLRCHGSDAQFLSALRAACQCAHRCRTLFGICGLSEGKFDGNFCANDLPDFY